MVENTAIGVKIKRADFGSLELLFLAIGARFKSLYET